MLSFIVLPYTIGFKVFTHFFIVTSSFTTNLKRRRDRGFHVYRELGQYLFKLGRRCVSPSSIPEESDFPGVYSLVMADTKALSVADFLSRSKLSEKLATACKLKAEAEMSEKKNEKLTLAEVTENVKTDFGRTAHSYVVTLFGTAQKLQRFTSDIVRGLGSFDLDVMLVDPISLATFCFKELFTSFRLRGVLLADEETIYFEEYLSFLDELRKLHPNISQPKLLIPDVIEFVCGQEFYRSRPHLMRIFRLSCLCLDDPRVSFPPVKFGTVHTDDPKSPMFDVVTPLQSYLSNVARGVEVFTSESSISNFLALEPTFGSTGLRDIYSPWSDLDKFGWAEINDVINSVTPKGPKVSAAEDAPSTSKASSSFMVPNQGRDVVT